MAESHDYDVFVDTGMFQALLDHTDEHHFEAVTLWKRFEEQNYTLFTSNYILDETFTLLRVRCGVEYAVTFRNTLVGSIRLNIERVTVDDEANAWTFFVRDWHKLSFTDCVSFAVMQRLGLQQAATFDEHFSKAGFIPLR
jgi:predicted nucleic acid-binding protein